MNLVPHLQRKDQVVPRHLPSQEHSVSSLPHSIVLKIIVIAHQPNYLPISSCYFSFFEVINQNTLFFEGGGGAKSQSLLQVRENLSQIPYSLELSNEIYIQSKVM